MKKNDMFENLVMNFSMDMEDAPEISKSGDKKGIPDRMVILARGLAEGWSLEKVEQELKDRGCAVLYGRSFYEACLMYAFSHGMGYGEWKDFFASCQKLREASDSSGSRLMKGGKITLKELKEYVEEESSEGMQTMLLTREFADRIVHLTSMQDFWKFINENIEKFSSARERARYYFCKYLYFYIQDRCDKYYESCKKEETLKKQYGNMLDKDERGRSEKFALEELSFLKPLTKLKRDADKLKNQMTLEEKKEYLQNTALTPGGIFDEFNYFYFGYVSVEWMEILFELYGKFEEWPENTKIRVAHSLGLCSQNPDTEEWKHAEAELRRMEKEERKREEERDSEGSRNAAEKRKAYQRGRVGEDYFREFMTGARDINRETLISFLLFVRQRVDLNKENNITINRLSRILENCEFERLRPDQEFDSFVLHFLRSSDPMEVLEEEVEKQVVQGKNFYLYRVYKEAYCHEKELLEYLL